MIIYGPYMAIYGPYIAISKGLRPHAADPTPPEKIHTKLMHRHAIKMLHFFRYKLFKWTAVGLNLVQKGGRKGSQSAPFGASKSAKMSTGSDRGHSQAS